MSLKLSAPWYQCLLDVISTEMSQDLAAQVVFGERMTQLAVLFEKQVPSSQTALFASVITRHGQSEPPIFQG